MPPFVGAFLLRAAAANAQVGRYTTAPASSQSSSSPCGADPQDPLLAASFLTILHSVSAPRSTTRRSPSSPGLSPPRLSVPPDAESDRKSTRLNSSHRCISYAVF